MSDQLETIEEIGHAVHRLREEVKSRGFNPDVVERINGLLDDHEVKVAQPLAKVQAALSQNDDNVTALRGEITELKEAHTALGLTNDEAKGRLEELTIELARGVARQDPNYRESDEYKALNSWCVQGVNMTPEHKANLRTDTATQGGVLVSVEMDNTITKKITEIDGIRAIARVRSIGSKSIELPIRNTIPVAVFEGEAELGTDSTSTYQAETVTPFRHTFSTGITQDMLMDAAFDMEAEITSDGAEAFAFGEGNGFVEGTGFKQPSGFTTDANLLAVARDTAAAGVLDPNSIILLTGDLKVGYNPVYVLNRRTLAFIRTMRGDAASAGDQAGQYLWMPGLNGPVANTLNGFPYVIADSMGENDVEDDIPIAFGDFRRGYTIVDRAGLSIIRDDLTLKKQAIVEFTMNRWTTGQVTLDEPIKLLRIQVT